MGEESSVQRRRKRANRRGLGWSVGLLVLGVAVTLTTLSIVKERNRKVQLQSDPRVATVWLAGITWGPNHTLVRGAPWQKWLNEHKVTAFGSYSVLHGQYDGEPGGVELWFDYQNHLSNREMECHRVGETAFVDDLGQPYHGYLDFQGKTVGVYLPAYDHAARRLYCNLHWMPRKPDAQFPVSTPMMFTVDLPPIPRLLPLAEGLPHGPQSFTRGGITIQISEAQLGPPEVKPSLSAGQRRLTFRMKVTGGEIANPNVDVGTNLSYSLGHGTIFGNRNGQTTIYSVNPMQGHSALSGWGPLSITDPYGIELIPTGQYVFPMGAPNAHLDRSAGKEVAWAVNVYNAGTGSDAIRIQFAVRPSVPANSPSSDNLPDPVPFDIIVPVQAGNEI